MAEVVAAIGVPHTPAFPALVAREGPDCETARLFAQQRQYIEQLKLDGIVVFDTDHLNTFFFDNLPIFAIGIADQFTGPNDDVPHLPQRKIVSDRDLSRHLHASAVRADFDVAAIENFEVDHSIAVPLHFLTASLNIPVVPIFISGHVPPLPSSERCLRFGSVIGSAIAAWSGGRRIAVMGSGSFSLEVYGPRIELGLSYGVPDPAWTERVVELLQQGDLSRLISEATPSQLQKAGNVGGELLNWIAMMGAFGADQPAWFATQKQFGHAYGMWLRR